MTLQMLHHLRSGSIPSLLLPLLPIRATKLQLPNLKQMQPRQLQLLQKLLQVSRTLKIRQRKKDGLHGLPGFVDLEQLEVLH